MDSEFGNNDILWNPLESSANSAKKSRRRSIRQQEIAEFTSQLAIMTRSGVDVASALGSLASQCKRPALAVVLQAVHESVLAGNTLSEALRRHEDTFDPSYIATVAAGEASGKMSEVLAQLAAIQRRIIRSRRTLLALMTYPALLMIVSSAVLVALVLFVLPRFAGIFEQYEVPLPFLTQALIALAEELWTHWWLWGPLAVGTLVGLLLWKNTNQGRRTLDTIWINGPVVRNVYRSQLVGRMCGLMGLMLHSGVPLVESLRLTRKAISNSLYRDLLSDLEDAVVNGRSLESELNRSEVLPQSAKEMMITAESTGKMGEVTQLLGAYYEEEAEASMRQIIGLLEPIITVGMGVIIAGVVLSVMMPVFDLSTLAKGH
ncbi:MAG: type II secretion system F family protein [Planctomycetales bacterium]|nr:type II secretion system F family protein [Planctomycetales bacterium]